MYIEITPTNNIVTFRYQTVPDYSSQTIPFATLKQDLVVTVKYENGAWTADHTYEEIGVAIAHGVLVRLTDATNDRYGYITGRDNNKYRFCTSDHTHHYTYSVTSSDAWTVQTRNW